ncbi:hypothetical protein BRADI_4g04343v3 [Brachypodium distachyon]|uniref:Uncharacterized protein n=1 Tax=Brachypodium distachyon TaxID=15368 RepID=A0A2K2CKF1_BRADI|nr:hypothetical protein BRADI_4g04343v3 [Brachypodium distachyon]
MPAAITRPSQKRSDQAVRRNHTHRIWQARGRFGASNPPRPDTSKAVVGGRLTDRERVRGAERRRLLRSHLVLLEKTSDSMK